MDVLPCGHVAIADTARMCRHLVAEEPPSCVRWLTGVGVNYDLLCEPCADGPEPRNQLIQVCVGCVANIGYFVSWRGEPEVVHHDRPLTGTWTTSESTAEPINDDCLAALPDGWLVYSVKGLVVNDQVMPVEIPVEEPEEWAGHVRGPALYASPNGRFAAVVNNYGRYGSIVDLSNGSVALSLDRNDYHVETTPFPFAFLDDTTVVAASDWNRLDIFDLTTGQALTERETRWLKDAPRPEYYLDYFHGALSLSPTRRWMLDDGWVWHPVGVPTLIDAEAWRRGDVHASEKAPSLAHRAYAWDQPVAWIDDATVAIQRIGMDDEAMLDGITLFDATSCQETGVFAGPAGRMWSHGGQLYVAATDGLEVWDPLLGARTGLLPGFRPTAQNPRTGELAELRDGELRTWRPGGTD